MFFHAHCRANSSSEDAGRRGRVREGAREDGAILSLAGNSAEMAGVERRGRRTGCGVQSAIGGRCSKACDGSLARDGDLSEVSTDSPGA